MSEKSVGIAAVLAATILMAVFATAITLSINYAEGQTQPLPPPTVFPPGTTFPTTENETDIVCSGFSYTCG